MPSVRLTLSALAILVATVLLGSAAASATSTSTSVQKAPASKAVFFAADGLRQDLVAKYAREGVMPTMKDFLEKGSSASGNGLLTQAPPNTGAGWYSLATGAWPAVHGSTNNTFHRNGQPFANRTAAFDPGVLQAESIAQAAERGGLKVAQVEWAGGRNATIDGPTIDFRSFFSGRGVATNFVGKAGDELFDDASFIQAFGLQFDHPSGHAGQAPFPGAAPTAATGWTGNLPRTYSPAREMRLRVLDFGTDKYGLNAWIFDSTNDNRRNYDRVLFSRTKRAADSVGILRKGQWADVKVKIVGGSSEGLTAGMLVRVEELTPDLSRVRLFHTSVSRAIATWQGWPGAQGFTGDFAEYLAQKFKTSTAADFAVLEAGIVSEETYVSQGLYWKVAHLPMLEYVAETYEPDLLLVGMPTTDEFQHQFLGLVSPKLPGGAANPAYDDVDLDGKKDRRVRERERFIRTAYEEADEVLTRARELMDGDRGKGKDDDKDDDEDDDDRGNGKGEDDDRDRGNGKGRDRDRDKDDDRDRGNGKGRDKDRDDDRGKGRGSRSNVTTFVASDHGFAPQFLAIDASKPLVDLGLLSAPQTSNCRPATGETIGKAKACWAGGAVQIYLNLAGRDPEGGGFEQVAAVDAAATVAAIKAAYQGLTDPNDWTGDGKPEGWKMIDRVFTKAEARYIPNGRNSTADMAHPTRTGDVIAFSFPPYQYDAETPGTLVAPSHFFGQHGYVPDVQDLSANINMRATFLAGGDGIDRGQVRARTIDLAPTLAFLLGIPEPQHSQGRVLLDVVKGGKAYTPVSIIGLNDFHGQLEPTNLAFDGINAPVGGAAFLATLFDEELAALPRPGLILAGGDNVGASPPNSALLEDRPTIDVQNAWGLDATAYGNHEFDYGVERLLQHQQRAKFPFLATNIVQESNGQPPSWVTPSRVFTVNGVRVGVIGAALESTPELVSAGATEGLRFLDEGPRIKAESDRLRAQGVRVQIVVIHEGTSRGQNPIGNTAGVDWDGPILQIADQLKDTTVDAMIVGHTHRISNLMRGDILITEGINAGTSYSVLQLLVKGGDVAWAGGATRIAKNLGVAPRADVKAIVDAANDETAVLRNQVIGTQASDILRDPDRLRESEMGNLVADSMRAKYPGIDAAYTNSGGLRADLLMAPTAGEAVGEITWGEVFAVLPFGNRTTIFTLTGDQLEAAYVNGFSPTCDPSVHSGRTPQTSGLKVEFHCQGTTPVIDGMWKAPDGPSGTLTPIGPTDTVRVVTNDFMYTGGDGYTMFADATDVLQPGDDLMQVTIDYIAANSPVDPVVDGRVVGP